MSERAFYRQPLLDTPFTQAIKPHQRVQAYLPWSGYQTCDVISSTEQEYFALRNACSVYDVSPMVKYHIAGTEAEAYLNHLTTRDVRKLKTGKVSYTVWANEAGHIIDDGTLYRLGETEFMLFTGERQLDWLLESSHGFNVSVQDVTQAYAGLSLQGPTSYALLHALGFTSLADLPVFGWRKFTTPFKLWVSRTGFTGDLGFELWVEPGHALALWERLMTVGALYGIRPIGSAALNIARIEAGFLMPKVDFQNAEHTLRRHRDHSVLELGLGFAVDFAKPYFSGKRALEQERQRGSTRGLIGIEIEGQKPAHNALLYADPAGLTEIGHITSAIWSPTLKRNLALALVERRFAEDSVASCPPIWVDFYLHRELTWERSMLQAWRVDKPFYRWSRRQALPPAMR